MSTSARSARFCSLRTLSKLALIVLCALCLQQLCGCASATGEEGVVRHAIKYATSRTNLDLALSSVVSKLHDAQIEVSLLSVEDASDGVKEIKLEPSVVSDTMASWGEDEWAKNRDDLFFNLVARFTVICKQAHEFGDLPQGYTVTCPDYMVVYNSQKTVGFVVSSTGVYQKTNDPESPAGEVIVLASDATEH